ncbi:MAG: CoA transferase [Chloroflexi bacterium]|nr:CoA transferase [Chloroflexota bacterium]
MENENTGPVRTMGNRMVRGRALDLADGEAQLCGRILSDLGIDVIRVERPGGDPSRKVGPFCEDIIHPERNLWWFNLNANKRGITLNLQTADGRDLFRKLAKGADLVIESFRPGYMAELGLGYPELAEINPRIVMTSITPFGQTGPYKEFKSSELVNMALGVFMYGTGEPDRAPVKPNYPLAGVLSGITAASATMIAHYHALKSGRGQFVDVSAQAGPPWLTGNVGGWWQTARKELKRPGPCNARRPDLNIRFYWECKDGTVVFTLGGGVAYGRSNKAMAQWVSEAGFGNDYFNSVDIGELDMYRATQDVIDKLEEPIATFLKTKTKHELAEDATKKGILLGYLDNLSELYQNPQLASGFWKDIEHPELGRSMKYPGLFFRNSLMECSTKSRAPLIGEHNEEVFGEIGVSRDTILMFNQAGVI